MKRKSPILIAATMLAISNFGTLGMSVPAMATSEVVWSYADIIDYQTEAMQLFDEHCQGSEDEKACRAEYLSSFYGMGMDFDMSEDNMKMQAFFNVIDMPIRMTSLSPSRNTMRFYTDYENLKQRLLGETDPAVYSNIPEEFFLVWIKSDLTAEYATASSAGTTISVKFADEIRAGNSLPSDIRVIYTGFKDQPGWLTPGEEFQIVSGDISSFYRRQDGSFYFFYRGEQRDYMSQVYLSSCLTQSKYRVGMDCRMTYSSYGNFFLSAAEATTEYRLAKKPVPADVVVEPEPEPVIEPEPTVEPEPEPEPTVGPEPEPELTTAHTAQAIEVRPTIALGGTVNSFEGASFSNSISPVALANDKGRQDDSAEILVKESVKGDDEQKSFLVETPKAAVSKTDDRESSFPWPVLVIVMLGAGLALWWLLPVGHKTFVDKKK